MTATVSFDQGLIEKYGVFGPRYTSYPTAPQFHEGFDATAYRQFAAQSNEDLIPKPLSLYLHLPFCKTLCYYCGCNKRIAWHNRMAVVYLNQLDMEIEMQGRLFDPDRVVQQLHLGGGTPTFHDDEQLAGTLAQLDRHFNLSKADDREFSIEIDPRTVDRERLTRLAGMGFNRLSVGVQDFDAGVQQAVNRVQDQEHTLDLIINARQQGFNSVSVDLIYGLPLQTTESFSTTLDAILTARPNRLAVYAYAHLPELFRAQRMLKLSDLPSTETRLALMQLTIEKLLEAGYEYIGMDHFALPDDELALARKNKTLQRNFQGYSTRRECDLVGLGVSAIGRVGNCFAQNYKHINQWQDAIESGELPIWRGLGLAREDRIRATIIEAMMCHGEVSFEEIEERFELDFVNQFSPELNALARLQDDGLVELGHGHIQATPAGRLLVRNIAMVFDEYLPSEQRGGSYSSVI